MVGAIRTNRAVLPHMRRQGSGLLVHVTSGLGRATFPAMGIYSPSKYALEALAETYRYELAGLGIDSVIVEPGVYPTDINVSPARSSDPARNDAYGTLATLATELPKQFVALSAKRDPGEIAMAIATLIDAEMGTRPLRTCVGEEATMLAPINAASATGQSALFEAFGMPELGKITA